jgi:hypothetical protein
VPRHADEEESTMRKSLLFLAVLVLALGALGFAAQLNVESKSLSAGSDAVESCDPDGVKTEYGAEFDNGRWEVEKVYVHGIDPACVGSPYPWYGLKVALTGPSGLLAVRPLPPVPDIGGGTVEVPFADANVPVADVTGVHVVIFG